MSVLPENKKNRKEADLILMNVYQKATLAPEEMAPYSNVYAYWECEKGHLWKARINNRANGTGCPYCEGKRPVKGENDLLTLYPEIAAEWHTVMNSKPPECFFPNSNKRAFWCCSSCGMTWEARIDHRVDGRGCPFCAGSRPIPGKTDFRTIYPQLAEQWDQEENGEKHPEDFTTKSHYKAHWKCGKGHKWAAPIYKSPMV